MSLAIQLDDVTDVLLRDGWYEVANKSFALDAYEYLHGEMVVHGGGQGGVCSAGFNFINKSNELISGPLTSIHAVKVAYKTKS